MVESEVDGGCLVVKWGFKGFVGLIGFSVRVLGVDLVDMRWKRAGLGFGMGMMGFTSGFRFMVWEFWFRWV